MQPNFRGTTGPALRLLSGEQLRRLTSGRRFSPNGRRVTIGGGPGNRAKSPAGSRAGDGVQAAFYGSARVLTISLHEHPATAFPGTGLPSETGGPGARRSAVNVALPAETGDAGWLRAFDAVVPPLLRAFRPQILASQHGCDSHWLDPMAGLQLSIDAQLIAHAAIHALAHEAAGGRWLLTGRGGYVLDVVPRTWAHLLAEAAGCPIDPRAPIPARWRQYASRRTSREAPEVMTEGGEPKFARFASGYDPADPAA